MRFCFPLIWQNCWVRISWRSLIVRIWVLSYVRKIRGVIFWFSISRGKAFFSVFWKLFDGIDNCLWFLDVGHKVWTHGIESWKMKAVVHFLDHIHILSHVFLLLQQIQDYCQYPYYLHKHQFWVRHYWEQLRIRKMLDKEVMRVLNQRNSCIGTNQIAIHLICQHLSGFCIAANSSAYTFKSFYEVWSRRRVFLTIMELRNQKPLPISGIVSKSFLENSGLPLLSRDHWLGNELLSWECHKSSF